jgi:hypothetical protein
MILGPHKACEEAGWMGRMFWSEMMEGTSGRVMHICAMRR